MVKQKSNKQLLIILGGIVSVFIVARLIAFLMLRAKILPMWLSPEAGGFRLHHFVYGNIIILVTSFLTIALQIKINKNILAGMYGIGLGLILDEFPHWIGYIPELNRNIAFIPMGFIAVLAAALFITGILFVHALRMRK